MATLFVMCGLPFSGKTTLSRAISERLNIPRISFDETWIKVEKELGTVPGDVALDQWKYINRECEREAEALLRSGQSVVYDNLGHDFGQRQHLRDLADDAGVAAELIYVDVDRETILRRRQKNLETNERAQVSDGRFEKALGDFQVPEGGEMAIPYRGEDVDKWIDENLI